MTPLRLRRDLPMLLAAVLLAWGAISLIPAPSALAQSDEEDDDRIEFTEREGDDDDHDGDDEYDEEEDYDDFAEEIERELAGFEMYFAELEAVTRIMDVVQQVTEIAKDPDAAAIAGILAVNEHHEEDEQLVFLESVLDEAASPTIKRAIRMRLIDVYKHNDQFDKAAEQARLLIIGQDG
ncbi:MAG: hypothetical protein AAGB29_07050 [Planctomycetota bacterium]